jgi:hypothetical protein
VLVSLARFIAQRPRGRSLEHCVGIGAALARDINDLAWMSDNRVNVPSSNMPEFQKAFSCRADAPMVRQNAWRAC